MLKMLRSAILAALSVQGAGFSGAPQAAPATAPAVVKITLEALNPVYTAGEPLSVRMHVDNGLPGDFTVPEAWRRGAGLKLRAAKPGPAGFETNDFTPPPAAAGAADYKTPPGSRLTWIIQLEKPPVPAGDAFDLFFLSTNPPAGSESVRFEFVENLRGAQAFVETDRGTVVFELAPESAPLATRNFVKLAEAGFYNGLAFHRIAKGMCIQAGDPESKKDDLRLLPGGGGSTFNRAKLPLERTRVSFERGTVGLARRHDDLYQQVRVAIATQYKVDTFEDLDKKLLQDWPSALLLQERVEALQSGSSQFFICTNRTPQFTGRYSAFAKVVDGMNVVDAIEASDTVGAAAGNEMLAERPVSPVRIRKIIIQRSGGRVPDVQRAPAAKATDAAVPEKK